MNDLRRLVICDSSSGALFFEKVWRWRGEEHGENVCTLLQVFFQFAREIDQGVVSHVAFGSPETISRRHLISDRLPSGRSGSFTLPSAASGKRHVRRHSRIRAGAGPNRPEICLACDKNDHLIAGLFYESSLEDDQARLMVSDYLSRFQTKFASTIQDLTEKLKSVDVKGSGIPAEIQGVIREKLFTFDTSISSDTGKMELPSQGLELTVPQF